MRTIVKQKAPTKRIVKVTIKREADNSPDTSWLGEYSNRATSEQYSIDRAHAEDCPVNDKAHADAVSTFESAQNYLVQQDIDNGSDFTYNDAAVELLQEAIEELTECSCGERGDMARGEYRYFNPSFNYVGKDGKPTEGLTPAGVRKYTRQDYDRMESLNSGNWFFIGLRAEAEIVISGTVQRVSSGGLWGIESDSDRDYRKSVEEEELSGLREVLHGMGFSKRAVSSALRNVEHSDE
jgi:hypothetical protein